MKKNLKNSVDLDFFSEVEVEVSPLEALLRTRTVTLGVKEIKRTQFLGLFTYQLVYGDGSTLKVDFNCYPFPRIRKGINQRARI